MGLYFEDLAIGRSFATGSAEVSAADIIDFARRFDPQDFHLDADKAAASSFGGLVASGLHTLSLSMRLFFDLRLWPEAILGSPGLREVQWLKPLRPGDRIHAVATVTELERSRSKPDRGVVTMRHDTFNERGERIMIALCLHLLRVRQDGSGEDAHHPAAGD
jgi:acyl dehydratase